MTNTKISSYDNLDTEPASLRLRFANMNSERGPHNSALLSPSGGGSRSGQAAVTMISQNDDVPENTEEEIRSISTLYNNKKNEKVNAEQL